MVVEPSSSKGDKKMWTTILAIVAFLSGGSGLAVYEAVIYLGDQRWVTITSQNKALKFEIEDELADIQAKIEMGTATERDRIRKAVLEERLKQLTK
jgi:hypothetical protein